MINAPRHPVRTGLATGMSVLLLTLSIAVPVLERGTLIDHPVMEQEHAPGECPSGHDHTICTQVGANLALAAGSVEAPVDSRVDGISAPEGARVAHAPGRDGTHWSRAPPLA